MGGEPAERYWHESKQFFQHTAQKPCPLARSWLAGSFCKRRIGCGGQQCNPTFLLLPIALFANAEATLSWLADRPRRRGSYDQAGLLVRIDKKALGNDRRRWITSSWQASKQC